MCYQNKRFPSEDRAKTLQINEMCRKSYTCSYFLHTSNPYFHPVYNILLISSCRKRSTHKNTGNFAVSGNVAYGEVPNVKSGMMSMEKYENINPDKIKPSDQTTAAAASIKFYENIDTIL